MSSLPTELMAGDTATFTVTAVDANGNIRTDYNGTLRIRSSDPQAILPPVQRFVNGIARNIPITLQTAGSQTVIAEDTVYPFSASRTVQVRISAIAGYRIGLRGRYQPESPSSSPFGPRISMAIPSPSILEGHAGAAAIAGPSFLGS